MAARTVNNFINGEWVPPSTSQYIDVVSPASGAAIAQVANSGAQVSLLASRRRGEGPAHAAAATAVYSCTTRC